MTAMLGNDTITVIEAPQRGPNGDPLPGTAVETDIAGCSVQPAGASETTDGRDTVITGLKVFVPGDAYTASGAQITAASTVRWQGQVYAVDAKPDIWYDLDGGGGIDHLEVKLRRVEG